MKMKIMGPYIMSAEGDINAIYEEIDTCVERCLRNLTRSSQAKVAQSAVGAAVYTFSLNMIGLQRVKEMVEELENKSTQICYYQDPFIYAIVGKRKGVYFFTINKSR